MTPEQARLAATIQQAADERTALAALLGNVRALDARCSEILRDSFVIVEGWERAYNERIDEKQETKD